MATTVKPAGLTITRAGLKFTLTWKCADEDYDGGIEVQWRSWQGGATKATQAWTEWTNINVLRGETTASKSFSASSFFPTTDQYLFGVVFHVAVPGIELFMGPACPSDDPAAGIHEERLARGGGLVD